MAFPLNIYLLAFLSAGLTSVMLLPLWRRWCQRVELVDDPGHRKIHETRTALAGGLAVFSGIILPLIAGACVAQFDILNFQSVDLIAYGFNKRVWQLVGIFGGAGGMLLLGLCDDKWELSPAIKFGGQLLIAAAVAGCGVRITLFVHNVAFSYAITIFWILTIINAFNFMDNMNGLCSGLGAIGAWYFGLSAALAGQYLVALTAFLACGALIGFLPHNFPKAGAFLGDSGSHLVGYFLAVLAILPHFYTAKQPNTLAVFTPLLVLAVPLLDLVWVVILRWKAGKPFYIGDTNHLSHRLVKRGLSRTQAVLWIWLLAALIGAIAFL